MSIVSRLGLGILALGTVAIATAPIAEAKTTTFRFYMNGKKETPPNTTKGKGHGVVKYDDATHHMTWNITYRGLTGTATMAHFHGPAGPGVAAKPIITIDPAKLASPIKGDATLTDDQAQQLMSGQWYFNVHTQANPNGEIRGQLVAGKAGAHHHRAHHKAAATSGAAASGGTAPNGATPSGTTSTNPAQSDVKPNNTQNNPQ